MIEANPNIAAMDAYQLPDISAPDGVTPIVLAQNEHSQPPSARVRAAIDAAIDEAHLYADTDCSELRRAIARVHDLDFERVFCGSGSMELMSVLVQCYLAADDRILMSDYSYLFMRTLARMVGATVDIAAERDLRVDVDALLAEVRPETRMVFVVNPGNPCGTVLAGSEIRRLRDGLPDQVLLLIDEAYAEYAEPNVDQPLFDLVDRGNCVITRTFSKIYGLAGLRVGWGCFPAAVLQQMRKVLLPGGVAWLSQVAARAAIDDQASMHAARRQNAQQRELLSRGLEDLGLLAVASHTNFVLAEFGTPERASSAFHALREKGIIVRPMGGYGLPSCLRITVGIETHMRQTLAILRGWRAANDADGNDAS